jgi:hypothetical protein
MADYLRFLWRSKDATLPEIVLGAARPLLEGNPALGLSVFVDMEPPDSDGMRSTVCGRQSADRDLGLDRVVLQGMTRGSRPSWGERASAHRRCWTF